MALLTRRRAWFILLGAAVTLCASAPVLARQRFDPPVVLPSVQVTRELTPSRNHFGQKLLVHPTNPRIIVIAESDLTTSLGNCPVHVSRDGGRTWATAKGMPKAPEYGSCTRATFGPSLDAQFGADGKTLFVLAAGAPVASGRGTTDVYLARSTDLGDTWRFTTIVKGTDQISLTKPDGTKATDEIRYNRLRLAAHPTDPKMVYAGIMSNPANLSTNDHPLRAWVSVSSNGGQTFGPMVDIFASVPHDQIFGADVPSVSVDREGTIYAFTKERPPAPPTTPTPPPAATDPSTVVTTTTTPATITTLPTGAGCPPNPPRAGPLTPPTTAAVPASPPVLGKAGAGDRLLMAKSTDGGKTWPGRAIDDEVAICRFCLTTPEGAVDPKTGNVYVVFEASLTPPPTPREDRNIYFMASTDGGQTWSKKLKLNDDEDPARKPNYNQLFPGISVAPNGRVDLSWFDFRSDALYNPDGRGFSDLSGEVCWDVYYTYSTDGGQTFARNLRVSDRSMNRDEGFSVNPKYDPRGPMAVASTNEVTYVAWPDSRAGRPQAPTQDTYFTTILHEEVLDVEEGGVKASSVVLGVGIGVLATGLLVFLVSLLLRGRRREAAG